MTTLATDIKATRTTILNEGLPDEKREEIRQYFHATYDLDERLFDPFQHDETWTMRADPLRHPLIFYFGHTAAFYINKLIIARIIDKRINPQYESMFAVGVDEMSWDDLDSKHYNWPTHDQVRSYRDEVRELVDGVISTLPLSMPINWNNPWWAIMMGIEHARIHLETSSVLIRQLPLDQLRTDPFWEICREAADAPRNQLLPVMGGHVSLGKPKEHRLYGWDNEFGRHEADVADFRASKYLVTNREFRDFVDDKGYQTEKWWTEEGWRWVTWRQADRPRFWTKRGGSMGLRTMLEEIDMPWNWPVEVNHLEAKAFCNWMSARTGKTIRMPSEDEWYRLRDICEVPDQPDWDVAPGNLNLDHYASSCPVTEFPLGNFFDVIGNVWQWTEVPTYPFEGFEVHPYYDDFTTPTFDGRHNLIKGGSWISTGNEATRDSRYAFRRHFFQHAGLRYVESSAPVTVVATDMYESDPLVSQYCEFHYGPAYFGVDNFPVQCARRCIELMAGRQANSALDIGCAVGRTSFELARKFKHVTGLDFSARFIRIAVDLKEKGRTRYELPEEGELVSYHEIRLADFGLGEVADRCEFYQADACNLKELYTGYDLVFAGNLIDRLYDPAKFLHMIHERINPGGLLVITSPYTWLAEHTERDKWIGGFRKDGEPYATLDALNELLGERFTRLGAPVDVPFVIRETARKFQHTLAQMTAWESKR